MSILTRPLLALSKTDRNLIFMCSDHAYKTQVGYGLFVLIVGIFAFFSSSYALRTSLDTSSVYLVAAVYGLMIMMIDREIVSVTRKTPLMIVARLVLAILIGLVVSVPLELRIFKEQILQQQKATLNQKNKPYQEQKEAAEAEYNTKVAEAKHRIEVLETEAIELQNRLTNELLDPGRQITGVVAGTGNPGEGPVYRRLQAQVQEHNALIKGAEEKYKNIVSEKDTVLARIDEEYGKQVIQPTDDLLSQYIALGELKQDPTNGRDATAMAWGVRLLLIMLELTPALIKLLQEENEYEALLRANRRRNITRIYSIANDHMDQLAQTGGQNPTPTLMGQLKSDPLTL